MRLLPGIAALCALVPVDALALDTWEVWDPMWGGLDMGMSADLAVGGPGRAPTVATTGGGWVYGYLGLGAVSLYGFVESYGAGDAPSFGGGAGLYGTPIDTSAFDLDLAFELTTYDGAVSPAGWIELTLDFAPDMALAGLFGRFRLDPWLSAGDAGVEAAAELSWTAGGYVTIDDDQVLLGYRGGAGLYDGGGPGGHAIVAGWNAGVADWGELVTEVAVAPPDSKGAPPMLSAFLQISVWFGPAGAP